MMRSQCTKDSRISQPPWSCTTPSQNSFPAASDTPPQRHDFPENLRASSSDIFLASARLRYSSFGQFQTRSELASRSVELNCVSGLMGKPEGRLHIHLVLLAPSCNQAVLTDQQGGNTTTGFQLDNLAFQLPPPTADNASDPFDHSLHSAHRRAYLLPL